MCARTLDVAYVNSGEYRYFDVEPEVYAWLSKVESKGRFVNRLVKEKYRYERLNAEPTATEQGAWSSCFATRYSRRRTAEGKQELRNRARPEQPPPTIEAPGACRILIPAGGPYELRVEVDRRTSAQTKCWRWEPAQGMQDYLAART